MRAHVLKPYRRDDRSNSVPFIPRPSAEIRLCNSLFWYIFSAAALSILRIFPRRGRIACVLRSRPCFAEPAAESPSTIKISDSSGVRDAQSASFPGKTVEVRRDFRLTMSLAARLKARETIWKMFKQISETSDKVVSGIGDTTENIPSGKASTYAAAAADCASEALSTIAFKISGLHSNNFVNSLLTSVSTEGRTSGLPSLPFV